MSHFITYALRGLVDQLKEQLHTIRQFQWETTWRNYIYERFGGKNSAADLRQRRLILDLSQHRDNQGWMPVSEIPKLTPRLAREYANKTPKTLSRDINTLLDMNLIQRRDRKIKANQDLILAFLPARATSDTRTV